MTDDDELLVTQADLDRALRAAFRKGLAAGRLRQREETLGILEFATSMNGSGKATVQALRKAWDESKHPRDHGKFASKEGAGGEGGGEGKGGGKGKPAPTPEQLGRARKRAARSEADYARRQEEAAAALEAARKVLPPEDAARLDEVARNLEEYGHAGGGGSLLAEVVRRSGDNVVSPDRPQAWAAYLLSQAADRLDASRSEAQDDARRLEKMEAAAEREAKRPEREARRAEREKARADRREKVERARGRVDELDGVFRRLYGEPGGAQPFPDLPAEFEELTDALAMLPEPGGKTLPALADVQAVRDAARKVVQAHKGRGRHDEAVALAEEAAAHAGHLIVQGVLKAWDESKHPRDGGKFASKEGGDGGVQGAGGAEHARAAAGGDRGGVHLDGEDGRGGVEHHGGSGDPDAKARTLAARIREVPAHVAARVREWVSGKYAKLSARYGEAGAKAVLGAMVLALPAPVPGTSLIPVAVAEAVLRIRQTIGKAAAHAPPGGVTVQGKEYRGGEFIPGEVMDRATDEEKAKVAVAGERPANEEPSALARLPATEAEAVALATAARDAVIGDGEADCAVDGDCERASWILRAVHPGVEIWHGNYDGEHGHNIVKAGDWFIDITADQFGAEPVLVWHEGEHGATGDYGEYASFRRSPHMEKYADELGLSGAGITGELSKYEHGPALLKPPAGAG